MRLSKQAVGSFAVLGIVLGTSLAVVAADAFQDRHMAMEEIGDAMKALGAMAKGTTPFKAAAVKSGGTTIADNLKKAATLFPAGSGGGESRARPEIWTDAAGFEKTLKDAQAAAVALQSVTDEAAFRPALGALGGNCKACHDKYRLPEKN
ncbi:MAG TPA: cytochrome c [Vicinamibacteria bacterium]|nr:cytochrome c [Vicinamibacteria bacterium]